MNLKPAPSQINYGPSIQKRLGKLSVISDILASWFSKSHSSRRNHLKSQFKSVPQEYHDGCIANLNEPWRVKDRVFPGLNPGRIPVSLAGKAEAHGFFHPKDTGFEDLMRLQKDVMAFNGIWWDLMGLMRICEDMRWCTSSGNLLHSYGKWP